MEHTLQGKVIAVCTGEKLNSPKKSAGSVKVIKDFGIEGDAHAGINHRQISIIDADEVQKVKEKYSEIEHGAFGENFIIKGVDLKKVAPGSVLTLGEEVKVEVTQIGKLCHDRCAIFVRVGECPMSSEGVFGRVLKGGVVKPDDKVKVEKLVGKDVPQCAIVVASDRCSKGETIDTAGEALKKILKENGYNVLEKMIVPDEIEAIKNALKALSDERGADVVFTAGGTGMSPRDVTPEATKSVIEREVPGIPEAIRWASTGKTPRAILSRGISGLRGKTLIINFPGSEKGVRESIEIILPVLRHAIETIRGDVKDCGR